MSVLNERIRERRNACGKTLLEVAETIGVKEATIQRYESGQIKNIKHDTILALSDVFNCSPAYLMGWIDSPYEDLTTPYKDSINHTQKGVRIPVLGRIPAGIPIEAIEDVLDYEEIPAELTAGGKEYFALKIQGNSMFPKYLEDDVVIFQKSPDCESGTDCAVLVNGEDATFKKVIKQSNGVVLQPLNITDFEPAFYSNEDVEALPVAVIGIAIEIRRKL